MYKIATLAYLASFLRMLSYGDEIVFVYAQPVFKGTAAQDLIGL
jgi:hypothetical protein